MWNSSANAIRRLGSAAGTLLPALILLTSLAAAPQTISITSPVEGEELHPGRPIPVTVNADPSVFQEVSVTGNDPIGRQSLIAPPYRFQLPIPAEIPSGRYPLQAMGITRAKTASFSVPVTIAIERPDSPRELESELSALYFDYVGDFVNMVVYGRFADGLARRSHPIHTNHLGIRQRLCRHSG